jgi:hypothetical protein
MSVKKQSKKNEHFFFWCVPHGPCSWGAQDVDPREIAIAYGRRELPKLLSVLSRPNGSSEESLKCLKALTDVLITQEQKAQAISLGAPKQIIRHLNSDNRWVCESACHALTKLVMLMHGREEAVNHGGVKAVTQVLHLIPVAATRCLMEISKTLQGAQAILDSDANVVAELSNSCKVSEFTVHHWSTHSLIVAVLDVFSCRWPVQ